jgi:hypothetical protein
MVAMMLVAVAWPAHGDETDNFTCRSRLTVDAQPALDEALTARIQIAIDRANSQGGSCGHACLTRELRRQAGSSAPALGTWIPHSRFARLAGREAAVERCHLRFGDSIYGAHPYNQPWLWPATHRIIFLADSILLSGRVIGLDKLDHFIREGRAHYDALARGRHLDEVLKQEQGRSDRPFALTEHGLRGRALTGVMSYADLAAGYDGLRFWRDLLVFGEARSLVTYDEHVRRFVMVRSFSFADYVTDAWDETVNRSQFHPALGREVDDILRARAVRMDDCRHLADLPDASLYVNPDCLH